MQRIGIYSGSFDPIHKGHVGFALEALKAYDLEKVIFLPEAKPRQKENVSPLHIRVKQIINATGSHPKLKLSILSSQRFTYASTMSELRRLFPNARFTLLMGSDVARSLVYGWEDAHKLFSECDLAIGLRGYDTKEALDKELSIFIIRHKISISYCTTNHRFESSSELRQASHAY